MNTFLVDKSFIKTAQYLDRQRLGKQRVEAIQMLDIMCDSNKKGWRNHPCFKMWDGHPRLLAAYGLAVCDEWIKRGYVDNLKSRFFNKFAYFDNLILDDKYSESLPKWYNNEEFYSRYRSILLYKNYEWYSQFGWTEEPAVPLKINKNGTVTLPYLWSVE
jgi:hypothetical protein